MSTPNLTTIQGQIDSLNQALVLANNAGQTDALPGLRAQLKYWNDLRAQVYAQQTASDTPSQFMQSLAGIGTDLQSFVGTQVGKAVTIVAVGFVLYLLAPVIIKAIATSGSRSA